jgi:predicted nucleic acid-binding protein
MKIEQEIEGVKRLFLDTAPVIYYIEKDPNFYSLVEPIFHKLIARDFQAVSSPITLLECSIYPCQKEFIDRQQDFEDILVWDDNTNFTLIDEKIAIEAVRIRIKYGLKTPDAIQIATAIVSDCDAFFTGDAALSKVTEIRSIVVKKLKL